MNIKLLTKNILSHKITLAGIALAAILSFLIFSNDNTKSSKTSSNQDIEQVIANWINNNPEAIIESIQNMQKKLMEEQMQKARQSLSQKSDELYNNSDSPAIDNGDFDVTIVEFFDYSCGYCKRASKTIEEITQSDKKVRFIHKHYPILGQPSTEMSQVALAINLSQPKLYAKFHSELMKSQGRGKDVAIEVAKKIGADIKLIEKTLTDQSDKIQSMIKSNIELGSSIGVSGTPGFVIGDELIPGAIDTDSFINKIKAIRNK